MAENLRNLLKDQSYKLDIENWNQDEKDKVMEVFVMVTTIWSILDLEDIGVDGARMIELNNC